MPKLHQGFNQLDKFNAKATFFLRRSKCRKHPGIFEHVKADGILIGSHTYNHISGWASDNLDYMLNQEGPKIS
ncbi:MAG: polysaccharide deacetylase family protein [Saprospiraceae bacterium]|nr:polysaccharide deacetylase family protein [Candidatus Vicinibacter affinis]